MKITPYCDTSNGFEYWFCPLCRFYTGHQIQFTSHLSTAHPGIIYIIDQYRTIIASGPELLNRELDQNRQLTVIKRNLNSSFTCQDCYISYKSAFDMSDHLSNNAHTQYIYTFLASPVNFQLDTFIIH